MTLEFLLTSAIVVASPGTGVVYTLAAGLKQGARASLIAAFGCTLGIVPHLLAAITGLAAVLHASATAFAVIKYVGVLYLLYMAWSTLRDEGTLRVDEVQTARTARSIVTEAILINFLNPKLSIFFLAFLPQFVTVESRTSAGEMTMLGLVFMAMTFAIFACYGRFAASVRRQVVSRPAVLVWLRRSFAAAFVALGLKLAFVQR